MADTVEESAWEDLIDAATAYDEVIADTKGEGIVGKTVEKLQHDALDAGDLYFVVLAVVAGNLLTYGGYRYFKWQSSKWKETREIKQRLRHEAYLREQEKA